jgi:anthranilate synthase component 2
VIQPDTLSSEFEVTAWAQAPDGSKEIMAVQHKTHPTFGVQFHPESFLTERGIDLLRNFVEISV